MVPLTFDSSVGEPSATPAHSGRAPVSELSTAAQREWLSSSLFTIKVEIQDTSSQGRAGIFRVSRFKSNPGWSQTRLLGSNPDFATD